MAGTVVSIRGNRWSASSWLFDWAVTTLATEVRDLELAAELRGLVAENLGWLALADFSVAHRDEISRASRESLVPKAERELPPDLENREGVLEHLRLLVITLEDHPNV